MNQIQKKQLKRFKDFVSNKWNTIFIVVTTITLLLIFLLTTFYKDKLEYSINGYNNFELNHNGMTVYYLDVGQGDCTFIEFEDGKTMLIDSGTSESANQLINILVNKIYQGKKLVIDYVLLTHSDLDHSGGMLDVMNVFSVNYVFRPRIYDCYENDYLDKSRDENVSSKTLDINDLYYHILIESFYNEKNCTVYFTDKDVCNEFFETREENFKFYFPYSDFYSSTTNDYSPIFTINYKNKAFMFTGDTNIEIEREVVSNYDLEQVDFLKVAHHGSKYGTSEELLSETTPKNSIISVGANSYGHPTWQVLNRLAMNNCNIFRTDKLGSIIVNVNDDNLSIKNVKFDKFYINIAYFNFGLIYYYIYVLFTVTKEKVIFNVDRYR